MCLAPYSPLQSLAPPRLGFELGAQKPTHWEDAQALWAHGLWDVAPKGWRGRGLSFEIWVCVYSFRVAWWADWCAAGFPGIYLWAMSMVHFLCSFLLGHRTILLPRFWVFMTVSMREVCIASGLTLKNQWLTSNSWLACYGATGGVGTVCHLGFSHEWLHNMPFNFHGWFFSVHRLLIASLISRWKSDGFWTAMNCFHCCIVLN